MTPNINLSVSLTPELRLEQALKDAGIENPASVICLTISGTMTEDDFRYIGQNMAKTLNELDMSNATVEGIFSLHGCEGLSSISIPASVESICITAFEDSEFLSEVTVHPDNPVYASENNVIFSKDKTKLLFFPQVFYLGEYIIPDSVTEIGNFAFSDCQGLTSIVIPASVTEIGKDAFYCYYPLCSELISITVHPENPAFASVNGVLFSKDMTELLVYPTGLRGGYAIPDSVVKIRDGAFLTYPDLTSVNIPASVIEIGDLAFSRDGTFEDTIFVTVHPDNPVYASENGKIKRKRKPKEIKKIKTLKDLHDLFNVPEKYRVMDEDSIFF